MTDLPIYQTVAVGDPNKSANVIKPNADGSINVDGAMTLVPGSVDQLLLYNTLQALQQLVLLNTQIRTGILLLLNSLGKPGSNFTIADLTGDF